MSDGAGEMSDLLEGFRQQMRSIAEVQRQRVRLTASATSRDKRVTVTVNANGVVIETKLSSDVEELGYDGLARTITQVAQAAAAEVTRKASELTAPLLDRRARLPKLSDVIEGLPDIDAEVPLEPPVSLAAPGSEERRAEDPAMVFTDVEQYRHDRTPEKGPGVTDSSW
ncbi:YbaB/EbfC family nucleoid-associated protein [Nocardia sp. CC227C]|uniref:YbaB/EbfC family nucleoid-associated protein n=1 Tax=Nocardia sp. CC227C TaxID=3044562 RepID=UPI00278BB1DC|nr:YbaB/EbfC family nucleoid-associated protein [Nocardia sp. CC227C]